MAVPSFGELWKLAKTVDDLLSMEQRNSAAFGEIARRLDGIELRLTRIESDRDRMVTRMRRRRDEKQAFQLRTKNSRRA